MPAANSPTSQLRPLIICHREGLTHKVNTYLQRMVSPLTGIDKSLAFSLQDAASPRVHILMAQLTAVHRLLGLERPFSYHIGGYGVHPEETMMRALGESLERYAHMVYPLDRRTVIEYATVKEMQARHEHVLALEDMRFYVPEQFARPGFPYQPCKDDTLLGWVETIDVFSGEPWWIPAQLLIVGYVPRHALGEPWITAAVTTGSAAHTEPARAMLSALLELIQVDTTMGYWYSDKVAPELIPDERTSALCEILKRDAPRNSVTIRFYYLTNADMQAHVVAAVIWNNRGHVPACGIGISAELNLELAMYKAYLEAAAIPHLALMAFVEMTGASKGSGNGIDPTSIYNLDTNVMYYAYPEHRRLIEKKFTSKQQIRASDLPADHQGGAEEGLRSVLNEFRRTGKRLALLDLSSPEIEDLHFYVFRFYSPDTLGLCLPSAPQLAHRRYQAYGGATHEWPHPYP
ncbi:YcaO-like family protein [Thermogemmatispora sp.]|uniref:YcaO-like family protein n=1 Tax=Thermogemmatispora sp. TaxID=1968838 RepID=UPI001D7CFA1F|nr:YcaO-like family protein [Thermogemmatispora sp.]MBX5449857.1 YcaO-like family protein [Thermogemmatispora sp.]